MKSRCLALMLVILAAFSSLSRGEDEQATPVVAEGVGLTHDEALKDAYRNAVRQIVGATVDSETVVSQDSVITDKVITLSNGTVKSHKFLSDIRENGLFRIRIVANVRKGEVVQRLRAAKISVKTIDTQTLVAEVRSTQAKESAEKISLQQRATDAEALFEVAMKDLSANLFDITADGGIKKKSVSGNDVTISYEIVIRPNVDVLRQCSKNIQRALEASSKEYDEVTIVSKEDDGVPLREVAFDYNVIPSLKSDNAIWLNIHANKKVTRTEWVVYHISKEATGINEIAERFAKEKRQVKVTLITADGAIIATDRFPLSGYIPRFQIPFLIDSNSPKFSLKKGAVLISPFIVNDVWSSQGFTFRLEATIDRTLTLDLDDISKIKKIRCELAVEQ